MLVTNKKSGHLGQDCGKEETHKGVQSQSIMFSYEVEYTLIFICPLQKTCFVVR